MGGQGSGRHNRISAAEHRLRGTFRPHRHARRELTETSFAGEVSEVPEPPDWLSEEVKVEYQKLAPRLVEAGMLTELDVTLLACLCDAIVANQGMQLQIEADGRRVDGPSGPRSRAHPLICEQAVVQRQILAFSREFGLTLRSRRREPVELVEEFHLWPPLRVRPDPDLA